MSGESSLTLFGLNLESYLTGLRLGMRQLLWGHESGVWHSLYPRAQILYPRALENTQDVAGFHGDKPETTFGLAVLPNDMVLMKCFVMPEAVESELDSAMRIQAEINTPFEEQDTCSGWRVVERSNGTIKVALAVGSNHMIQKWLESNELDTLGHKDVELWAQQDGYSVLLRGSRSSVRERAYMARLRGLLVKSLLAVLGIFLMLFLPVSFFWIRAEQLAATLMEVEDRADSSIRLKNELFEVREAAALAGRFLSQQPAYNTLLDSLSDATPDSVYFTRIGLANEQVTVSGMAENAAEYQTLLSGYAEFDAVGASSAFTRDTRVGLERFTLTFALSSPELEDATE